MDAKTRQRSTDVDSYPSPRSRRHFLLGARSASSMTLLSGAINTRTCERTRKVFGRLYLLQNAEIHVQRQFGLELVRQQSECGVDVAAALDASA